MESEARSRLQILGAAFAIAVAVAACTTSNMQAYEPIKHKTSHSEEVLVPVARAALESRGYVAIAKEDDPSAMATREKEVFVSSVPRLAYRYTLVISTKDGVLTIDSTCQKNTAMERQEFESCGDERPEKVITEQEEIKKEILDRLAKKP
jgi:hypothetical protein